MPGAATPTVAPQGANAPFFGNISPLTAQLSNERGYANSYGPFLPRMPRSFTDGAFGPFSPILPVPVDEPAPGAELPDARLWQYMVGWNLPVGQPGTEGIKLADFGTLKTLADLYSVARACIELRKNEIIGLDWDVVPTKDAAKAYHGSDRQWKDFGARRAQALKFFRKPDPDYFSYDQFMAAVLEEIFVFDALSILIRPKRGQGIRGGRMSRVGWLGSDLDCIELISGPTMRPLVGMHGEIPRPPNPAYQQYLYGVPRSDYMTMVTERDIDEGGLTEAIVNSWTSDQFLYLPMVPRRWTPYGFPPIERALVPVMSGLQKQAYQLDFFKEGTIPAVYISPGDVNMTPNQIRELQDALNAFAGDPAWHHKVIVLPPGSKVDPQKPVDVADQFDDVVMTQVCMAFDVNPMELGILPKVSATATPSQVKQLAQGMGQVHERLSTKPLLKFLSGIFDVLLHDVMHQEDMTFTFEGLQEDAEQGALTDLLIKQVQSGLRSVDEARDQLELQPWGLDATSEPVVFTAAGPIPFGQQVLPATPGQAQGGQQNAAAGRQRAPTAGPAPLPQAGRQGAPAAPTPGHASARATNSGLRAARKPQSAAPAASGSVTAQKLSAAAVESELDMLVRHLNKGRRITTWEARHIPSHAMAVISEDLSKGLSPEQCADIARTIVLSSDEYEWLPKADAPWGTLHVWEERVDGAFGEAISDIDDVIRRWWAGQVMITRQELLNVIAGIIRKRLEPVLSDLWAEGWRHGDETAGGLFEAWEASYGRTVAEAISRTRVDQIGEAIKEAVTSGRGPDYVTGQLAALLDVGHRSRLIAVTEMARAATDATVANFRRTRVAYKHWQTRDDARVCQVCRDAQDEGPVPLESLFANGLPGPPAHPQCRCTLVPGYMAITKDQSAELHGPEGTAECDRGHTHHGEYGGAGLLIRHRGDDGKLRYLLQKRSPEEDDPGTWSIPGGALLQGEQPLHGAYREAGEEMGDIPPSVTEHHRVVDDHGGWAWTTLVCDTPEQFAPSVDGATSDETAGWGWFTADEISRLDLHPHFKESWDAVRRTRKSTTLAGKCVRRRVNLDGQEFWEVEEPERPYPQAAGGGGPEFMPHDAQGIQQGRASGSRGGGTSGHIDDASIQMPRPPAEPSGDDGMWPQHRGVPPHQGGGPQGYQGGHWPRGGHGTQEAGPHQPVSTAPRGTGAGNGSLSRKRDAKAAVEAQMRENFPDDALTWMREAKWSGPHQIPLRDIDFSDRKEWSAYKEPDRVKHFERLIEDGEDFNPPVLVRMTGKKRLRIVDGHHRGLAYYNKGLPLKEGWIGDIPAGLQQAAEETHSSQEHQGASEENE